MTDKKAKRVLLILALGFSTLGIIFSIKAIYLFANAYNSKSWPTTKGMISSSQIKEEMRLSSTEKEYEIEINYSYSVNGIEYTSMCYTFSELKYSSENEAKEEIKKYIQNSDVTVYYDSTDPAKSVLKPGPNWQNWKSILIGFTLLLAGILCFFALKKIEFD